MSTTFEAKKITSDLARLGVQQGDLLLVHASLSSLGQVEGGAQTVIEALKEAVDSEGTLLMPALSYTAVNAKSPVFSLTDTPCCVGAIPECFRKMEGTQRSLHPTHSVCASGALAQELTLPHALDNTPVGPHSPLSLLAEKKGKILMLGCGLCPNTSLHGIEERVRPPYLFKKEKTRFTLVDAQGRKTQADYFCHDFKGFIQRYDRVAEILPGTELRRGAVFKADCFLINAASLWEKANDRLQQQPLYFVDRVTG